MANISDSMHRLFAGGSSLRPLHQSGYMCGPALTVRTRPGDNLFLHKALDMAEPGDVIVVDGGGELSNALIVKRDAEAAQMARIADGSNDRTWVDSVLKARGCAIEE
ncbi:hypothetical protein [Puniceibacterium sp. IMCC21224]|uniref:RraA family protein n=1 Tax=Puniceibacterium sp. IMCC21224 TaxID=1618204 RepID=UPI00069F3CAF|nr:hypothetical protein [Puniceibacterium sp. IMCC21224]